MIHGISDYGFINEIMDMIEYEKSGKDDYFPSFEFYYNKYKQEGVDFIRVEKALEKVAENLKGQLVKSYADSIKSDDWRSVLEKVNKSEWGGSITPRLASRVASRYLEKQGFNKYNVPELVGQLMSVLEKNGLEDTVAELKQKGFTKIINKAWQDRNK